MKTILLIEDEESLNRGITLKLQKEGYHVLSSAGVTEGVRLFGSNSIDLIICDIGLEDGNGLDFCSLIRKQSNVLLIFLTALDTEIDIVNGYDVGADDYITKPFSLLVLISKVNALMKRTVETSSPEILISEDIMFNKREMKVYKDKKELSLSKNELKLLNMFLDHPRYILSKRQLLDTLWDMDGEFVDENTIAVNIRRLREKIEKEPSNPLYIKNVRGMGYIWDKQCCVQIGVKNDRVY